MTQHLRRLAAAALLSGAVVLRRAFQVVAPKPQLSPQAQALKEAILEVVDKEIRGEYELGLLYRRLVEEQLYQPYPSALAWWDDQLSGEIGSRAAERYYRLTLYFDRATFRQWGVVKLEMVVRYLSMKRKEVPPDPSAVPITWIVAGKEVIKPFADCSVSDLLAAVHPQPHLPQPGSRPGKIDKRLPEWTRKFIALLQNRLHDHMDGTLGKVHLEVKLHRKEPIYALTNLKESELFAVLDILSKTAGELGGWPSEKGDGHGDADHT
jgi:hypothetical protein